MSRINETFTGMGRLDARQLAAYRYAVEYGQLDEQAAARDLRMSRADLRRACHALVALRLLRETPGASGRLIPASPEVATNALVGELERTAHAHGDVVARVGELLGALLGLHPGRTGPGSAAATLTVEDPAEVELHFDRVARHCTGDVLLMQPWLETAPGQGDGVGRLDFLLARNIRPLAPDVQVRVLYQHSARATLPGRTEIGPLLAAAAEVRTTEEIAHPVLLVDEHAAFLPAGRPGRGSEVAVVFEPTVVGFLRRLYEHSWAGAQPLQNGLPESPGLSDPLRSSILRLMSAGLKDEVVARRLGMSARTCRRHIATIMQELRATSRFQAGVEAVRTGLLRDGLDLPPDTVHDGHS
jgi:DNA-binding NarL/FixJ family response regulator